MGCRRRAEVVELERLSLDADGTPRWGAGLGGRGAWVCAGRRECLDRAIARRSLARALRVTLPPARLEQIVQRWEQRHGTAPPGVRAAPAAARD